MPFITKPMSVEFWLRIQNRLAVDFQGLRTRLPGLLTPLPATIESAEMVLPQAAQSRLEAFASLREMENMQMLILVLRGQLRRAMDEAEIFDVENHIQCLRNVAGLYGDFLSGLPRRAPAEQELQAAVTQYANLRSAGNNESLQAERQRLRSFSRDVAILGAEDTANHDGALRSMQSEVDEREAELQSLKTSTQMALTIPDGLANLVASYGLFIQELESAPQRSAPDAAD